VAEVIHPRGGTSLYVLEPLWVPAHLIEYLALTTILLGFVGWYSRFSTSLGRLGTVGFLLSFFGAASGGGYILVSEVLLRPYIAASSPSLDEALLQNGAYVATTLIVSLTLVVGYLALSVAVCPSQSPPQLGFLAHCSRNNFARFSVRIDDNFCSGPRIRGPFWTQRCWLGVCHSLDAEPSREF